MNRKHFISTIAGATATAVAGAGAIAAHSVEPGENSVSLIKAPDHKVKRGVALYSYQRALKSHSVTLENCIEELSDIGAYGIEAIGQVIIKDYPNPSDRWIGEWWEMMDKYGTTPVCYTNFHDQWLQKSRPMTTAENLEHQMIDFNLGRRMGFTKFRMLVGTPIELMEAAIPVCEKLGLWMGLEIHAPVPFSSRLIERILGLAEKHPDAIGLLPDMGIFQKYPSPSAREQQIAQGTLTRDIALYIEDAYRKGLDKAEVVSRVKGMKPRPGDTSYADMVYSANPEDPKDLIPIMKYCRHIHGKFHEMNKGSDYTDARIIYDEVVPVLMQYGYDGYICTEFEGQRFMDAGTDEFDQVRRQHVMLKRLMGK
ncbi:MAG: hypothetical protein JXA61_05345 [Bacteroidales bacterium]|nr:hypothetical protein [Bacteroidales bacterium]